MGVFPDLHICYIPRKRLLHVGPVLCLFVSHCFALTPLTPPLNLCSLIFSVMPCGWLSSVMLNPYF
jgi:hypothetical protein